MTAAFEPHRTEGTIGRHRRTTRRHATPKQTVSQVYFPTFASEDGSNSIGSPSLGGADCDLGVPRQREAYLDEVEAAYRTKIDLG